MKPAMSFRAAVVAAVLLPAAGSILAAAPPSAWETPIKLSPAELEKALAASDAALAGLPAGLTPALTFQRLLLRIRGGAPVAEWREVVGKFAASGASDPVSAGLKELALAWEARARMLELDSALRQFYRNHVRFPEKLGDAGAEIPAAVRTDPWGDPWSYSPKAPSGFSKTFAGQRYFLAPSRHPQVRPIAQVLRSAPPARTWVLTSRTVGGQRVLEFRLATGQKVATQAGGRVDDAMVLYIGDGWALLSDLERLFTVTF